MDEYEKNYDNAHRALGEAAELLEKIDDEPAESEVEKTSRRWAQAVSAADHHATYGSSVRDYNGWQEKEDQQQAS